MKEKQRLACLKVLDFLESNHKDHYVLFDGPAEATLVEDLIPVYRSIVKEPRDLRTIRQDLEDEKYLSPASFEDDMVRCFQNSKDFCKGRYPEVVKIADFMLKAFKKQMEKTMKDLSKLDTESSKGSAAPKTPEASAASNGFSSASKSDGGRLAVKVEKQREEEADKDDDDDNDQEVSSPRPSRHPRNAKAVVKASTTPSTPGATMASASAAASAVPVVKKSTVKAATSLPGFRPRCEAILAQLTKLEGCSLLMSPVDPVSFPDYPFIVKKPMCFNVIKAKLLENTRSGVSRYENHNEFALDVRRVYANFLRFNWMASKDEIKLRQLIGKIFTRFETSWALLEQDCTKDAKTSNIYFARPLPEIDKYLKAFEDLYKLPAMHNFIHSIEFYFRDPAEVQQYLSIVKEPISVGEIVARVVEGECSSLVQVLDYFDLLVDNCEQYWSTKTNDDGSPALQYLSEAKQIRNTFRKSIKPLLPSDGGGGGGGGCPPSTPLPSSSSSSSSATPSFSSDVAIERGKSGKKAPPPPSFVSIDTEATTTTTTTSTVIVDPIVLDLPRKTNMPPSMLERVIVLVPPGSISSSERRATTWITETAKRCISEAKRHYIRNPITRTQVSTALPFLKAVDPIAYPDYLTIIQNPIDFAKIEKNLASGRYQSLHAIVDDVDLIRRNAHQYNVGTAGIEIRIMADGLFNFFKFVVQAVLCEFSWHCADLHVVSRVLSTSQLDAKSYVAYLSSATPDDVIVYLTDVCSTEKITYMGWLISAYPERGSVSAAKTSKKIVSDAGGAGGGGAGGGGGGGGKSTVKKERPPKQDVWIADIPEDVAPPREKLAWELAAEKVITNILKHSYVDKSSPKQKAIADFFSPLHGNSRRDDQDERFDMNLQVLCIQLDVGEIMDQFEFFHKLISIFQLVVDNITITDSTVSRKVFNGCKHLVDFSLWNCLELLPYDTATSSAKSRFKASTSIWAQHKHEFSVASRDKERVRRLEILQSTAPINLGILACRKFMKSLESGSAAEKKALLLFSVPVDFNALADYSMVVRRPMDLGTIKTKLDRTDGTVSTSSSSSSSFSSPLVPTGSKYKSYAEFVADMRLVFDNAIKYNATHLETDTSGQSRIYYDAAVLFKNRLEKLLPEFTIDLIDRIRKYELDTDEIEKMRAAQAARERAEREREMEVVRKREAEARALQDAAALEEHRRRRESRQDALKSSPSDDSMDLADWEQVHSRSTGAGVLSSSLHHSVLPLGDLIRAPKRFSDCLQEKVQVLEKAWQFWLTSAVQGKAAVASSEETAMMDNEGETTMQVQVGAVNDTDDLSGLNQKRKRSDSSSSSSSSPSGLVPEVSASSSSLIRPPHEKTQFVVVECQVDSFSSSTRHEVSNVSIVLKSKRPKPTAAIFDWME